MRWAGASPAALVPIRFPEIETAYEALVTSNKTYPLPAVANAI